MDILVPSCQIFRGRGASNSARWRSFPWKAERSFPSATLLPAPPQRSFGGNQLSSAASCVALLSVFRHILIETRCCTDKAEVQGVVGIVKGALEQVSGTGGWEVYVVGGEARGGAVHDTGKEENHVQLTRTTRLM